MDGSKKPGYFIALLWCTLLVMAIASNAAPCSRAATYADDLEYKWTNYLGGSMYDQGYAMAASTDGVYMCGDVSNASGRDAFIAKYTKDGALLWNHTWGGSDIERGLELAVVADGVYMAGETHSYGAGHEDVFLIRYASNGTKLWNCSWGGASFEYCYGIALAADGIYIAGATASFGAGNSDAFLLKLALNGTRLWNVTWGGALNDEAGAVVLASGGVYIAGSTRSLGIGGNYDAYIARYGSNGTQLWNHTWGGTGLEYLWDAATGSDGVYLAGSTNSFGAGNIDAFLVKYSMSGTLLWNRTWGGTSADSANAVEIMADGSIFIVGETSSFGAGGKDACILKYTSNGDIQWNCTWGGTLEDLAHDIDISATGMVYISGRTYSFGAGLSDAFLLTYRLIPEDVPDYTGIIIGIIIAGVAAVIVLLVILKYRRKSSSSRAKKVTST